MLETNKSYWTVANALSLGNIGCGTLSIFEILSGNAKAAAILILGAVIFDFLDGKAARALKQDSIFGKVLDSLSDMVSFGVAPAVFGFSLIPEKIISIQILLLLFVFAGAWRLAFYTQWSKENRPPGMPITFNGLFFPALFFLNASAALYISVFLISIVLMVLPIFWSRPSVS